MKRIVLTTLALLTLAGAVVTADGPKDKKKKKDAKAAVVVHEHHAGIHVTFAARDVEVIRSHYRGKHNGLPPGLAKKYARTGQLPPGWQKKMEPLSPAIERSLPPLPKGYRRGVIDAHAVIYDAGGMIVDVAVLF
jgi:hypothetical protein